MKYKLLSVNNYPVVNIGDYVQALSASQFLPNIDGFINRELLKDYQDENSKVIMNGWFMFDTKQWPPSSKVFPLFIAFHINSLVQNEMTSNESIEYLKKYEPIGCRDYHTVKLLKSKGVDAYFSGCLTLTLGYKYYSTEKNDKCYFVDPAYNYDRRYFYRYFFYTIKYFKSISSIAKKWNFDSTFYLDKIFRVAAFYHSYRRKFSKKMLLNSEYVCQQSKSYKEQFNSENERLKEAERLIKNYAKARLVVTSRIHCGLPCLGLETPVIYTEKLKQSEASSCRMAGLIELFNVINIDNGLSLNFDVKDEVISETTHIVNPKQWELLSDNLRNKARSFINPSCQD